jgi:hypothetical protein
VQVRLAKRMSEWQEDYIEKRKRTTQIHEAEPAFGD